MSQITAILMTILTVFALIVRWDYDRKRPAWIWTLWKRKTGTRAQRWIGRGLILTAVAAIVVAPVVFGPSAGANPFSCAEAPEVDTPGKGFTAALDPGAATPGDQGSPRTPYGEYGYAGQLWHTYDLGCTSGLTDPISPAMTALANGLFNVAKDFAAMTNGLHYLLLDPHAFDWLNALVQAVSGTMFEGVFSVWAQLALLIFGSILLWHGKTGDNAGAAKRGIWAIIGFWMAASAALLPVTYNDFFREHLVAMTGAAQAGFVDPSQSDSANAMPDAVMKTVVYDNWLTGEFGASDNEQAKKYGAQLLDAQACNKREHADGRCNTEEKRAKFEEVAQKVKDDNQNYTTFQGTNYWPRVSAATIAVYQGFYVYLFQLISKVIIVLSLVMIAVLIFLLPITGLLGMINPDTLRANIKTFGTAFVNAIMMGLLGGLHTRLVIWGTEALPFIVQSLFLLLVTILLLMIARPIKRMKAMLSATMEVANASFPANPNRLYGRPHPYRPLKPSDEFFQAQRDQTQWYGVRNPGLRWHSMSRGNPEEQAVGGPYARPAAPNRPGLPGGGGKEQGGGTVFAHATQLAKAAALTYATGGSSAGTQMAASAIAGGRNESGLAGRLGEMAGLPAGSGSSESGSGSAQSNSNTRNETSPVRDQGASAQTGTPSSFGMIETEPDYYRPTEAESADTPPVLDAQQDESGTWYVPGDIDDSSRGTE